MIPKNIFQIWVGNNPPKWAFDSFIGFSALNPDFQPTLLIFNEWDSQPSGNMDLSIFKWKQYGYQHPRKSINECLEFFKHELDNPNSFISWKRNQNRDLLNINNSKVMVSDLFRFILIKYFGGIYVDSDCYPIKPFDEKLLKKKQFFVGSYYGGIHVIRDNFFLGSDGSSWIDFSYLRVLMGDMPQIVDYSIKDSAESRIFLNGEMNPRYMNLLSNINKRTGYIQHYFNRSWK